MPSRTAEEWAKYIEAAIQAAISDGWDVFVDPDSDLVITSVDSDEDYVWVVEW